MQLLTDGGTYFEAPRWREGRWWVSDFYHHAVLAIAPDGASEQVATVAGQPSGMGWLPDGSLLVVSMKDHTIMRRSSDGELTVHADLTEHCGGHANDMVVTAEGNAYVGNFGFDLMGGGQPEMAALVLVRPDGSASVVAEDLWFPNGSVVTPDGRRLIVGETLGCRYSAFTIEADGSLADRRVWAQLAPTPERASFEEMVPHIKVAPDGCALDAEGQIWAADALGQRVIRIAEGGEITDEIPSPEGLGVYACMLGGDDGRTLLLCTAPDFFEHLRSQAEEARLFTTTVEVPRAGLP
jgi:sugar lactone lactonase YvrE